MTDINKAFAVGFKQAFDKRFFSYCNNSTLSTRKSGYVEMSAGGGESIYVSSFSFPLETFVYILRFARRGAVTALNTD